MKKAKFQEWGGHPVESTWSPAESFSGGLVALDDSENRLRRLLPTLKAHIAEAWKACGAFEWLALAYLAVSSILILTFAQNLAHPLRLLVIQMSVAAVVLALCLTYARSAARAELRGTTFASQWWHFWRHWYPHLFFLFCFEELGHLVKLVNPEWQDAKLIALDYWLTGVHPSVWIEQFATPFRNDAMQLIYFTYFTYLLIVGGVLYFRRDWRGYWSVMTYSMLGYSIGYIIAILFPIESPWFSMAGWWKGPLQGGPFTAMMAFIEHYGRVRGAAFPSAHVTGATAALLGAWKYRRWLFWLLLPLYLGMCLSTVWGRYHYVVDVFAGMLTGTVGYLIGSLIMKRPAALAVVAQGESLLARRSSGEGGTPTGPKL
jgi:membrane-associated phospholipid phosphatase